MLLRGPVLHDFKQAEHWLWTLTWKIFFLLFKKAPLKACFYKARLFYWKNLKNSHFFYGGESPFCLVAMGLGQLSTAQALTKRSSERVKATPNKFQLNLDYSAFTLQKLKNLNFKQSNGIMFINFNILFCWQELTYLIDSFQWLMGVNWTLVRIKVSVEVETLSASKCGRTERWKLENAKNNKFIISVNNQLNIVEDFLRTVETTKANTFVEKESTLFNPQTCEIGIHSFRAWRLTLTRQCGEKAAKCTCVVGKRHLAGFPFLKWHTGGRELVRKLAIMLWSLSRERRINN